MFIMNKKYLVLSLVFILFFGMFQQNYCFSKTETGYNLKNPQTKEDDSSTWDCVYFGRYWQNDTNQDGVADKKDDKEPIKWRVLQINGDDAFLLSDKILDVQKYNKSYRAIQWEDCSLRQWLNQEFFINAFNEKEREGIIEADVKNGEYINEEIGTSNDTKDKVYLLSKSEVRETKFGFSYVTTEITERQTTNYYRNSCFNIAECSQFAIARGVSHTKGKGDWWLRSVKDEGRANAVSYIGFCTYEFVAGAQNLCTGKLMPDFGVRPVIHLDLSKQKIWKAAGQVVISERNKTKQNNIANYSKTKENEKESLITDQSNAKKPGKIKSLSLKAKKGKRITVKCKKVKEVAGYQIQYALSKKKLNKGKKKNTDKTSMTIRKLKKKKTYYVRVRAFKVVNKKNVYGVWSAVKRVKIKK